MLSQAALCLAFDDLPAGGGVLTPATAMGGALTARLRENGFTFDVAGIAGASGTGDAAGAGASGVAPGSRRRVAARLFEVRSNRVRPECALERSISVLSMVAAGAGGASPTNLIGMSSPVLTAVAWPYANGPRHIGHVSGFGVPADVFSRYQRMAGNDVLMVSGTDEHGTPILVQADAEGVSPRVLADRYNRVIVNDLQGLGLSYDLFTRTSTRNHYAVVQELFRTVHRNGYFVPKTTMSAISPSTGRTLPDRYIEGTCPICGYDGARGDQCDNCGNQLDPIDLINPKSTDQRRDADLPGVRAVLPRPAGAGRRRWAPGCRPGPTGGRMSCGSR